MINIDKYSDFHIDGYSFKNYITLSAEQSAMVLECRNHPDVRKWMFTKEPIPIENHLAFVNSLKQTNSKFYWAVFNGDNYVGSVDITDINTKEESCIWGFFLNPRYIGTGKGIDIEFVTLKLLFYFGFRTVRGEVNANNNNALNMHKLFGYTIGKSATDGYKSVVLDYKIWKSMPDNLNEFKRFLIKTIKNRL